LAYHWGKGEDVPRTIDYLELAGDQAMRNGAYEDAIRFFNDAVALTQPASKRPTAAERNRFADWYMQLGEAYYNVSSFRLSRENFNRSLELLGEWVHRTTLGLSLSFVWQLCWQAKNRLLNRGPHSGRDDVALMVTRIHQRVSQVTYVTNEILPGMAASVRMVNAAERSAPSPELLRAYSAFCMALGKVPLPVLCRHYTRLVEKTTQYLGESDAWSDAVTGAYYQQIGDWENDDKYSQRSFDFFASTGHGRMILDEGGMRYFSARWRGQFAMSLEIAAAQMTWARSDDRQKVASYMNQARTLLTLDRTSEALELLQRAASLERDWKDFDWFLVHGALAHALLHSDDLEEAHREATAAFKRVSRQRPTATYGGEAYCSVVEVQAELLRLGLFTPGNQRKEALKELHARIKKLMLTAHVHPIWRPAALRYLGVYHLLLGRHARARGHLQHSLREAQQLQMRYEEALTMQELARLVPGNQERFAQLEAAANLFESLGAARNRRLVQKELLQAATASL
jgi:tetratricopeptide (TPR) repeat protein